MQIWRNKGKHWENPGQDRISRQRKTEPRCQTNETFDLVHECVWANLVFHFAVAISKQVQLACGKIRLSRIFT